MTIEGEITVFVINGITALRATADVFDTDLVDLTAPTADSF